MTGLICFLVGFVLGAALMLVLHKKGVLNV